MGLFDRFHLPLDEAEAKLGRALSGDPTKGEIGVLMSLNNDRFDEARKRFETDRALSADFRNLVEPKLRGGLVREDDHGVFRIRLHSRIVDHFLDLSHKRNLSIPILIEETVAKAVEQQREGADILAALRDHVASLQRSMNETLSAVREAAAGADAGRNVDMRLTNIERSLQALVTRR